MTSKLNLFLKFKTVLITSFWIHDFNIYSVQNSISLTCKKAILREQPNQNKENKLCKSAQRKIISTFFLLGKSSLQFSNSRIVLHSLKSLSIFIVSLCQF